MNKVIQEDPMCCLVPNKKYTDFFYELYISISYPYTIEDSEIIELEKIQELKGKLKELESLFSKTSELTDKSLKEELTKKEYNRIKNNIIELEKSIVNLTMTSGK